MLINFTYRNRKKFIVICNCLNTRKLFIEVGFRHGDVEVKETVEGGNFLSKWVIRFERDYTVGASEFMINRFMINILCDLI